jgi:hypothetical protein
MSPIAKTSGCPGSVRSSSTCKRPTPSVGAPDASASAVAEIYGVRLEGFLAFAIWGVVHLVYLVGWGNRFEAVARWLWTILARNRRERVISMDSARTTSSRAP